MIGYLLLFICSLFIVVFAFFFQEQLANFQSLGLFGIFLINFFGSATIFLPAPAIATVVAGGAIYPAIAVAAISALGAAFGDMVGFFLGHSGRRVFIKNHEKVWQMRKSFHKFGDIIVFVFALVPNPVFDAIGIFAGAVSYSPIRFFIALFAGRFVRDILLAYFGARIF